MTREELLRSEEYWMGEYQYDFFELIMKYLKDNNLSQKEFAKRIGVSPSYINQIIKGEPNHRYATIVKIALAMGKVPRLVYYDIDTVINEDRRNDDSDFLSEELVNTESNQSEIG